MDKGTLRTGVRRGHRHAKDCTAEGSVVANIRSLAARQWVRRSVWRLAMGRSVLRGAVRRRVQWVATPAAEQQLRRRVQFMASLIYYSLKTIRS